jgi:hypothetical protein
MCFPDDRYVASASAEKGKLSLFTLVCSPRVRKNRIRCVIKRRRCPGRLLLLLESHLLNSSIKPTSQENKDSTAKINSRKKHY